MAKKIEALRGMEDLLPGEIEKWQWVEEKARIFFESRGFKEIRTPLLESTDLFVRSVGESSDIVHKEMFSFQDRGERHITLRPEMTASVARSVIEKGLLSQAKSLRFYYIGPMFRAERPQAGRKRQFHQIGIEMINETGWQADLECVELLAGFLAYVGLAGSKIRMNDLGSVDEQKQTAEKLRQYFEGAKDKLCKDCQWRLEKNVLRIFDCKTESCQSVIDGAPWEKIAPLGESFNQVAHALTARSISYEIRRRLVRGLDYYNGLVFEATASGLGAQDALAGGGRYDRLYPDLGGPTAYCTGFSLGVERLLSALTHQDGKALEAVSNRRVYLAPLDATEGVQDVVRLVALRLRERGIRIETLPGEISLSKHLKRANQNNIRFVLILGGEEFEKKSWMVKDMEQKTQHIVSWDEVVSFLSELIY